MAQTGCLPKSIALGKQMGKELLALAQKAHAEGKISEDAWKKLPDTPEAMWNLVIGNQLDSDIAGVLLDGIVIQTGNPAA